mmetsp:Transcript_5936/g.8790  ORF Transcript_5936/g.8790 Transcript_5936/m.8790 type:complete len:173 (-) Transcript_5936:287-805(-)
MMEDVFGSCDDSGWIKSDLIVIVTAVFTKTNKEENTVQMSLLRDAITAVDEIVREEHQRLKLHDLVSDDDDDSDNDDMQQQQQQVGFIGRSKRHRRNSCALTSSDTSQESLSSAIMLNSLSLCDTFLRIQSPLPTVTTTTTSSQRTSSPSSARRVSDEDLQISTLFNAATLS